MKCPKCGEEKQKVIDTRPFGEETYRKRRCLFCDFTFVTYERAVAKEDKERSTVYIKRNKRVSRRERWMF